MRKKQRQLCGSDAISIIEKGEYGILSTVSLHGEPYGVPVNYCFIDQCIYLHCAPAGKKLDHIAANPKVSFCIVGDTAIQPERFTTKFESAIVSGTAEEVFGEEKKQALAGVIKKYALQFQADGLAYVNKAHEKTKVIKIVPTAITGKASR